MVEFMDYDFNDDYDAVIKVYACMLQVLASLRRGYVMVDLRYGLK